MEWQGLINEALKGDTKTRLTVLPKLQALAEQQPLGRDEASGLLEAFEALLKDNNFKVCQGILLVFHTVLVSFSAVLKPHLNIFLPPTVERLGDMKQSVREAAQNVILSIFEVIPPGVVLEKLGWAWVHKSYRIREELCNTLMLVLQNLGVSAISLTDEQKLLGRIVGLLDDSTASVRESALSFLGEYYSQCGGHLVEQLGQFDIPPAQIREVELCFAEIDPAQHSVVRTAADKSDEKPKSAASSRPSSGRSSTQGGKRGGYGDSGGLTADGELPPAELVSVRSENDLKAKIAKIVSELDTKNDWEQRIKAMMQLEGLVLGGATQYSGFTDSLRSCKDGIVQQLADRRSAVARVACHMLGELSTALGSKFEPFAVTFVPEMIKVSVYSVKVMVEAANDGLEVIFRTCRTRALLPTLLQAVATDKNKAVRTNCAKLLLLTLEMWEKKTYERVLDNVEKAISAAVQDAQADTRTYGRLCYGAYSVAWPSRIPNYLKKLLPGLREKMIQAGAEYVPFFDGSEGLAEPAAYKEAAAYAASNPSAREAAPMRPPAPRSSVAGGALRVSHPSESMEDEPAAPNRRLSGVKPGRVRTQSQRPASGGAKRTSEIGAKRVPSAMELGGHDDEDGASSCTGYSMASSANGVSLASILKRISSSKSASDWEKKRDGFVDLRDWARESGYSSRHEIARMMDRLVPLIMDSSKDAHHQVVVATMEAWGEVIKVSSQCQEPYLERLMSSAFLRAVDSKAVVRNAALTALRVAACTFGAETLISAFNKCMNSVKTPKGRQGVLELYVESVGPSLPAGIPVAGSTSMTQWLKSVTALLMDKNIELRQVAATALEHTFKNVDDRILLAFVTAAPAAEQTAIKRAMKARDSSFAQGLLDFQRDGGVSLVGAHASSETERQRRVSLAVRTKADSVSPRAGADAPRQAHNCLAQEEISANKTLVQAVPPVSTSLNGPAISLQVDPEGEQPMSAHPAFDFGVNVILTHLHAEKMLNVQPNPPSKQPAAPITNGQSVAHAAGHRTPPRMPATHTYMSTAYLETPGNETNGIDDPAAASARLRTCVTQLNSQGGDVPVEAVAMIQHLARFESGELWDQNFGQVLMVLQQVIARPDCLQAEHALEAIHLLSMHHGHRFCGHLEGVIPQLLQKYTSGREIAFLADEAMEELMKHSDAKRCLSVFSSLLPSKDTVRSGTQLSGKMLGAAIRNLTRVVAKMSAQELHRCLDIILPGLVASMESTNADVRKEVVFCYVEMYFVLGDAINTHLSSLSAGQQKLITIYINRRISLSDSEGGDAIAMPPPALGLQAMTA